MTRPFQRFPEQSTRSDEAAEWYEHALETSRATVRRRHRNQKIAWLIAAAVLVAAAFLVPSPADAAHDEPEVLYVPPATYEVLPEIPEEDEPGWDCETMGNRICGPIQGLTPGEDYAELNLAPPAVPVSAVPSFTG